MKVRSMLLYVQYTGTSSVRLSATAACSVLFSTKCYAMWHASCMPHSRLSRSCNEEFLYPILVYQAFAQSLRATMKHIYSLSAHRDWWYAIMFRCYKTFPAPSKITQIDLFIPSCARRMRPPLAPEVASDMAYVCHQIYVCSLVAFPLRLSKMSHNLSLLSAHNLRKLSRAFVLAVILRLPMKCSCMAKDRMSVPGTIHMLPCGGPVLTKRDISC